MEVTDIFPNVLEKVRDFADRNPKGVIIIRWPTATWKTDLSIKLAEKLPSEIISADSRQIYKYMDIWTDKVSKEIRERIPHFQIDIVDPSQLYTAWERKKDTENIISNIHSRWKIPIIVWGTWLYIDTIYKNFDMPDVEPDFSLREKLYKEEEKNPWILYKKLQEVDPLEAQKLHPNTLRYIVRALEIYYKTWKPKSELARQRPVKWPLLMIWLRREKEDTNKRINKRIKKQIEMWLVDEVKWLLDQWYSPDLQSMQWLWYKEIVWYLQGRYDLEKAVEILKRNTHRYAKRQRTWFRRYIAESKQAPRQNVEYLFYNLTR